jgi:uncharacterized membrane protein
MPKKKVKKVKKREIKQENNKLLAFLTTFLSIIGFIIALIAWRKNKYVMFYASQSLIVFLFSIVVGIVERIFSWIPVLGGIINIALGIMVLFFWLISWINALSGEMKEIPIIGKWGRKIKL